MKKWLKRKLRDWVDDAREEPDMLVCEKSTSSSQLDSHMHNPINFSIYTAQGGRVLEVRQRDRRTDDWVTSLHVIKSDEDFGTEIANIVFMETLKRGN